MWWGKIGVRKRNRYVFSVRTKHVNWRLLTVRMRGTSSYRCLIWNEVRRSVNPKKPFTSAISDERSRANVGSQKTRVSSRAKIGQAWVLQDGIPLCPVVPVRDWTQTFPSGWVIAWIASFMWPASNSTRRLTSRKMPLQPWSLRDMFFCCHLWGSHKNLTKRALNDTFLIINSQKNHSSQND